ncbi:hypothetical protein C2S52_022829 [Perilla frutescens var. hirtella]|nr:hypothetical protein C2S52_022829 [Perilla frutescens var. hirtella]KAH6806821.1 hypothetical protein C2S51_027929 [Perilla frutescens var. frutescens]
MAISAKFIIILSALLLLSVISSSSAAGVDKTCKCTSNNNFGVCDNGCRSRCAVAFGKNLVNEICTPSEGKKPSLCFCLFNCPC